MIFFCIAVSAHYKAREGEFHPRHKQDYWLICRRGKIIMKITPASMTFTLFMTCVIFGFSPAGWADKADG
jgi:hypothetical protein